MVPEIGSKLGMKKIEYRPIPVRDSLIEMKDLSNKIDRGRPNKILLTR